jgi:FKBP-type peptidyl-prolyl cis-trans isomerase FklB
MIMITKKWVSFVSVAAFTLLTIFGVAQSQAGNRAGPATVKEIQLTFKRDLRDVDPFRGVGVWSTASVYTGAAAQNTVEIRAEGVDASGRPTRISPEWASSDPEIATVSPGKGDDVKVTVHKEGESNLKVTYQGVSKELVLKAQYAGKLLMFQITPPPSPKPTGPVAEEVNPALKTEKAQLSYAAGRRLAKTLRAQSVDVDPDLVSQAMKDVLAGGTTLMSDDQERLALMGVETQLNVTAATVEKKKIVEKYKQEADTFLAENKKKEGIVTLPDGLQYRVIKAGNGKKPTGLDVAVCQYTGRLIDGTVFDDSHQKKGGGPVNFPVRAVIRGWQEALKMMPAGSKWQIFVPPDLAYGEHGVPQARIPPNAALVFEVELLSVRGANDPPPATESAQKTVLTPEQMEAIKKMVDGKEKESEKSEKN